MSSEDNDPFPPLPLPLPLPLTASEVLVGLHNPKFSINRFFSSSGSRGRSETDSRTSVINEQTLKQQLPVIVF
jgi:hypothetical protein